MSRVTVANCDVNNLMDLLRTLHPVTERRTLIFAAGVVNNRRLLEGLGSQETSQFYDGMVAGGHLAENPYWPDYARGTKR